MSAWPVEKLRRLSDALSARVSHRISRNTSATSNHSTSSSVLDVHANDLNDSESDIEPQDVEDTTTKLRKLFFRRTSSNKPKVSFQNEGIALDDYERVLTEGDIKSMRAEYLVELCAHYILLSADYGRALKVSNSQCSALRDEVAALTEQVRVCQASQKLSSDVAEKARQLDDLLSQNKDQQDNKDRQNMEVPQLTTDEGDPVGEGSCDDHATDATANHKNNMKMLMHQYRSMKQNETPDEKCGDDSDDDEHTKALSTKMVDLVLA